jgi:hypothetical protein
VNPKPSLAGLLAGLLLFGGCVLNASCDSEEPSQVMAENRGDTVIVNNAAPLYADTVAPILERTWGRSEGADDEIFTQITAFAVGPGGRVYVHDIRRGVRWFHADGSFGGYVARFGEGPDEVRHVVAMDVSPDGVIAAWDVGNQKLLFYSHAREPWSHRAPLPRPAYDESALVFTGEGDLWLKVARGLTDHVPFPRPEYVLFEDGALVDTIMVGEAGAGGCAVPQDLTYRSGFWDDKRAPWIPLVTSALSEDGAVVAGCPSRPSFHVEGEQSGGGVLSVHWPQVSLRVGDEERAFFEAWRPMPALPDARPYYARLIAAGDDRIWVWPNQAPEEWTPSADVQRESGVATALRIGESGAFEVFRRDGRWVGTVALPENVRYSGYPTTPSVVVRGDTIWAVTVGPYDVQTLGRYRVDWVGPEG